MSTPLKKAIVLLIAASLAAGLSHAGKAPAVSGKAGLDMRLPRLLSDWIGTPGEPGEAEKKLLPPDTQIEKMVYRPRSADAVPLQVTIVLSGKDRTSIHRPEVCLTAQGWNIKTSQTHTVDLANGEKLKTRVLAISRENTESKTLIHANYAYWFVGTDSTTEDHVRRIVSTATNNLIHQTNPRWAYVSVLSVADQNDSPTRWISEAVPQFQTVFAPAKYF